MRTRMADDAPEGVSWVVQFRNDILRGIRLFLIGFAAILIVVWAYRMLHPLSDVQGAAQLEVPAAPQAAQPTQEPATDAAPIAEASSEPHGLMVPPPPPVGGTQVSKVTRPKVANPPPPPPLAVRARRAPAPSGREFETAEPEVLPAAPDEETADSGTSAAAVEPAVSAQQEPPAGKPKGNRFFRAVGKIFHPGGKKETVPLTLQQPKQ